MKYFKYKDEELGDNFYTYNEFDDEYYCLRAVYEEDGKLTATNVITDADEHTLPEGNFIDSLDTSEEIQESEFSKKWKKAIEPLYEEWANFRNKILIGQKIIATINVFYPQGIILNLGAKFHGIADRNECARHYGEENTYPQKQLTLEVVGFDENNMWIILKPE